MRFFAFILSVQFIAGQDFGKNLDSAGSKTCLENFTSPLGRMTIPQASYIIPTTSFPSSQTFEGRNGIGFNASPICSTSSYHWAAFSDGNGTGAFDLLPTSPPLRLPVPKWDNETSTVHAPTTTSSRWRDSTNITRNVSSPTAYNIPYSAGWSLRHLSQNIWQVLLISLFVSFVCAL
jgi:hypothetical protein